MVAEPGSLVLRPNCQELAIYDDERFVTTTPLAVDVVPQAVDVVPQAAADIPDGRDAPALPIPTGSTSEGIDEYFEMTYVSEVCVCSAFCHPPD